MTRSLIRCAALLLTAGLTVQVGAMVTPAWACGCGAYSPERGGSARVPMETALVR